MREAEAEKQERWRRTLPILAVGLTIGMGLFWYGVEVLKQPRVGILGLLIPTLGVIFVGDRFGRKRA